jgi:hypothetical protein
MTDDETLTLRLTVIGGQRCADDYQVIWRGMAPGRLFDRQRHHCRFDLRRDTVLEDRLLAANLGKRQLAAFVIQLLEPVEAVATISHEFVGTGSSLRQDDVVAPLVEVPGLLDDLAIGRSLDLFRTWRRWRRGIAHDLPLRRRAPAAQERIMNIFSRVY